MTRNRTPRTSTATRVRRLGSPSLLIGLVALGGCGSTSSVNSKSTDPSTSSELDYDQAGVGLNLDTRDVASLRSYMYDTSDERDLPQAYLSEGRMGLSDVEGTLASARALEVEHAATLMNDYATLDSERQDISSAERSSLAEAEFRRRQFDAEVNDMFAQVTARRREIEASGARHSSYVDALVKERSTQSKDMASHAEREYNQSLARLENLRTVRDATEQEGQIAINAMTDRVQISRDRVIAVADNLRREAQTTQEQSDARASEFRASIVSIEDRSDARSSHLRAEADSAFKQAKADAYELRAQAESLEARASDEQHNLRLTSIETGWNQSQAEFAQASSDTKTTFDRALSETQRLRTDADSIAAAGRSTFEQEEAAEYNAFKNTTAQAQQMFTAADRAETAARTSFVQAEANARIKAAQKKANHENALADAQVKEIIAASEAEATRVQAAILDEFAKQQQSGSVAFDDSVKNSNVSNEELHSVPPSPVVAAKTPKVEATHIASYRVSLAKVMQVRVKAQTTADTAQAEYQERKVALEAELRTCLITSAEKMHLARTRESQADADFAGMREKNSAVLSAAESGYRQNVAKAESFRKDAIATATELFAEADATELTGEATRRRLRAEAEVAGREASEQVRVVHAQLQATHQRGSARHALLVAEADSAELSANALATEMEAQIAAAHQTLEAELAQLDQNTESSTVIAEADFSEAMVYVDSFVQNTEFEVARLRSSNELELDLASRDNDFDRNRAYTTVLRGEAEVHRMVASASALSDRDNAYLDAGYTSAHSSAQIARADVESQRQNAWATRDSVVSRFGSRLAQTDADRVLSTVDAYRYETGQRVSYEKALAEAEAAQAASQDRLARLSQQQHYTQETAVDDWNSRLANVRYKTDVNTSESWSTPADYTGSSQVADVPTDNDW